MSNEKPFTPAAYRENPTGYVERLVARVESREVKIGDLDTFDYFRYMDATDNYDPTPMTLDDHLSYERGH